MIRMFRSKDSAEAIASSDGEMATVKEIIKFTGFPVTVDYDLDGNVRAGVIKSPGNLLVVNVGQYVYRESSGKIGVCNYDQLIEKYEEVTEETAS